jgi:cytoplasmic iron level regulating protein YaaA (DUF328/UPF0246 family)
VQGCSDRKHDGPDAAFDLYDGYYYRILKKAKREDAFDSSIDVVILSAEYGLLDADERIESYDREMSSERASEFQSAGLPGDLADRAKEYDCVVVNLGAPYREAIDGFADDVAASVTYLSGQLGERGRDLKSLVRTDEPAPDLSGGQR